MKKKVKIKFLDEEKEFEIKERDKEFINIVNQNKHYIYKNKKLYTRKLKHKNKEY